MPGPKASLTFWGSSHLKFQHFFPQEMRNAMRKNGSEERFQTPEYKSKSGGKITQDFVDEFISDLRSQGHLRQPQVHVIIIGGNNLREAHRRSNNSTQQEAVGQEIGRVLRLFEQMFKAIQEIGSVEVLIGSLIPSPATYQQTEDTFVKVHCLLRRLVYRFEKVQFCNFTNMHFVKNHQIRTDLFERDRIHLNQQGAKLLTTFISNRLIQLAKHELGC